MTGFFWRIWLFLLGIVGLAAYTALALVGLGIVLALIRVALWGFGL